MTSIHSLKQCSNDQQDPEHSTSNFRPSYISVRAELKHDGNKTNYANQVSTGLGDEEE